MIDPCFNDWGCSPLRLQSSMMASFPLCRGRSRPSSCRDTEPPMAFPRVRSLCVTAAWPSLPISCMLIQRGSFTSLCLIFYSPSSSSSPSAGYRPRTVRAVQQYIHEYFARTEQTFLSRPLIVNLHLKRHFSSLPLSMLQVLFQTLTVFRCSTVAPPSAANFVRPLLLFSASACRAFDSGQSDAGSASIRFFQPPR